MNHAEYLKKIHHDLRRPFDPEKISWRVGATNAKKLGVKPWEATEGALLAYIDARDVMKRLDDVMGDSHWQAEYLEPHGKLVICRLGLFLPQTDFNGEYLGTDWVWKSNGAGETDVEGEKGSCSDAFKRAAVLWGVGQYLYHLKSKWVNLEGGKYRGPNPDVPYWATPEGYDEIMTKRANAA